jgi:adenylate cyclase
MSMAALVAHCGRPERTLRRHFQIFMGHSPLEFWRRARLAAVRDALLTGGAADAVTEIAARHGFTHFGRFSQQYREAYGELPSATLSRQRLVVREGANATEADVGCAVVPHRLGEQPSVAILPCEISVTSPECRYFGAHLIEELATALCRDRSLSVRIARGARVGGSDPAWRCARDLGVRYVIANRMAQNGSRIRITIRLLEAANGRHVWGNTYDGTINDVFTLQDRLTNGVTRSVLRQIRGAEIERARRKPPNEQSARDLVLRAWVFVFASQPDAARQALDLLQRAMEIDPDYAPATALAAWCHAQLVLYIGTHASAHDRAHALRLSARAGILDQDDPLVLAARCAVHTMAGQLEHADELVARALAQDPTFTWGWDRSGWINAYRGKPETAIRHFNEAARLDVHPPNASRLIGIGCAHFDAGRYGEAVRWKQLGLRQQPGTGWVNRTLSVSFARLGERLAALEALEALHQYSPDLTIGRIVGSIPFSESFLDRVAQGLDDLGLTP